MTRTDLMLAVLSPAEGKPFTPVQVQKLLFLIDREIPEEVGGPHFDFRPYGYGPYDGAVYEELELLADEGMVHLLQNHGWQDYALTVAGQDRGEEAMRQLWSRATTYIRAAAHFVRKCTFTELVTSIYTQYPEMRANSVFQDAD